MEKRTTKKTKTTKARALYKSLVCIFVASSAHGKSFTILLDYYVFFVIKKVDPCSGRVGGCTCVCARACVRPLYTPIPRAFRPTSHVDLYIYYRIK